MTTLGIALALGCAATANLGMLCKHRGACEAPEIRLRSPWRSAAALFRSRWWTIGFAMAVIAGGLVLIAFPAQRYFNHRLNAREWLGLALAAAGLAFLAVTVPHASEN